MSTATPLVTIKNHHADAPPSIIDANYIGYFENAYGEQWLFWRAAKTGRVYLTGGDIDWTVHEITPAWFTMSPLAPAGCPLVLSAEERHWIVACWQATQPAQVAALETPQ